MKTNKTKVLHVLHELKFSGAEIMYVDAAPVFHGLGCELSVLATAENLGEFAPFFEKAGYVVYHKGFPHKNGIIAKVRFCRKMIIFINEKQFDIVHIHAAGMRWWMSIVAWWCGVKSVYTFHNVFSSPFHLYPWHFFQRWSAKNIFGCRFQTISQSVYENERKRYFNKTSWVNNWYSSNRFYPATIEEKQEARASLSIDADTLVLISVGGCSHVKRHSHIIEALSEIKKKYPDTLYLHLGKGVIEEEEIELSTKLGMDKYVRFCGNIRELRQYLIASDIYLMPSKYEGMPITTIEVMGCQIPCILYKVPGLKDFNRDGENSRLIAEDYHILAREVINLYSHPDQMEALAKRGKLFVDKSFSLDTNAKQIFELYNF